MSARPESRAPKSDQTLYRGKHDAIIDEAMWRRAQEIRKTNTSKNLAKGDASFASRRYALSGVLRCPCGAPMKAGSTSADKRYGYYCCANRKYFGPGAPGGCSFPRYNTDRVHEAFWTGLAALLSTPDLVDRVHAMAQRLLAERQPVADQSSPQEELRKVAADLDRWYERHDRAGTDVEREAAWQRVLQLTKRKRQLATEAANRPRRSTAPAQPVSREQVARRLGDLTGAMRQSPEQAKAPLALPSEFGCASAIARIAPSTRTKE